MMCSSRQCDRMAVKLGKADVGLLITAFEATQFPHAFVPSDTVAYDPS